METDRRYFLEGLFVIGFAIAAAFFFVWLAGTGHRDDVLYRIHFGQSVTGLSKGDAVKFSGVDIGTVEAMALDPRILFLDEPTSDLDPLIASGIDGLIKQLNQSLGITVVIVTHDLATLFTICGRVAVLVDKKITVGTVDNLMRSRHPWIREFLHGPRAQGALAARRRSHGNG